MEGRERESDKNQPERSPCRCGAKNIFPAAGPCRFGIPTVPEIRISLRWAIIRKAWRPGLSMAIRTPPVRGKSPPSRSGCGRWPGLKSLRQIMAINQSPVGRVCLDNRDSVRGAGLQHGKIRAMAGVGENGCCCLFASPCLYLWLWRIFRHGSAWAVFAAKRVLSLLP